jgi:hypothetical protein
MDKFKCPDCGIKVKDLMRHTYRAHKQVESYCDECGKSYRNKFQLKQHWKLTHEIVNDVHCSICSKSFQNMGRLKRHTKNCIAKQDLNVSDDLDCSATLRSQNCISLSDSEDKETVEKEAVEKKTDEKETDEKETDEKETDEKETDEKETDEKETDEKETDEKETVEKESVETESGEKETIEKETVEKETVEKETVEIETDEIETNIIQTNFEANILADSFDCNLCDSAFPNITKLKLHTIQCLRIYTRNQSPEQQIDPEATEIKDVEDSPNGNAEEYYTYEEQTFLNSLEMIVEYKNDVEPKNIRSDENPKRSEQKTNYESIKKELLPNVSCGNVAAKGEEIISNDTEMEIRNGVKSDIPCENYFDYESLKAMPSDLCCKIVADRNGLNSHIERIHLDQEKVACEHCGKQLRKQNIKSHVKLMHDNFEESKCLACHKVFFKKNSLRAHLRNGSCEEKECSICHKVFPKRHSMVAHLREVHSGEKAVCDICCNTFNNRTYLQRHIRTTHNNSLSYPCQHCDKPFKSNARKNHHISIAHEVNIVSCDFCSKDYKNKMLLYKHVRKYHR